VTRWVVSAALLQYATTGIAMPFEMAKTLMQVQWIPKDCVEGEIILPEVEPEDETENEKDDSVRLQNPCFTERNNDSIDERGFGGIILP
jgi:fusion and transport protein UGO1